MRFRQVMDSDLLPLYAPLRLGGNSENGVNVVVGAVYSTYCPDQALQFGDAVVCGGDTLGALSYAFFSVHH